MRRARRATRATHSHLSHFEQLVASGDPSTLAAVRESQQALLRESPQMRVFAEHTAALSGGAAAKAAKAVLSGSAAAVVGVATEAAAAVKRAKWMRAAPSAASVPLLVPIDERIPRSEMQLTTDADASQNPAAVVRKPADPSDAAASKSVSHSM